MKSERLLFAVHLGSQGNVPAGIIMDDHCLPLAVSHWNIRGDGDGFDACWARFADTEEFFTAIGLSGGIEDGMGGVRHWFAHGETTTTDPPDEDVCAKPGCELTRLGHRGAYPNGLWVYEVEYSDAEVEDESDDEWPWLCGGTLRRLTPAEATRIGEGLPPWDGGAWL